jgi:hypothetical protein
LRNFSVRLEAFLLCQQRALFVGPPISSRISPNPEAARLRHTSGDFVYSSSALWIEPRIRLKQAL